MRVLLDIVVWGGLAVLVGWAAVLTVICGLEFGGPERSSAAEPMREARP